MPREKGRPSQGVFEGGLRDALLLVLVGEFDVRRGSLLQAVFLPTAREIGNLIAFKNPEIGDRFVHHVKPGQGKESEV